MCAVVKDQNADVREWLDWHLALGVGRIYFTDNNSSVPMLAQMADLVASGRVVYTFFAKHARSLHTLCATLRHVHFKSRCLSADKCIAASMIICMSCILLQVVTAWIQMQCSTC